MAARRHLPILNETKPSSPVSPESTDEARPPWHWIGFGTVAIFTAWLPLAYVAQLVTRILVTHLVLAHLPPGADASSAEAPLSLSLALDAMTPQARALRLLAVALPHALAFAVAAFAGGFLVGRFGHETGAKEGARAGACAALVAVALAWSGFTLAYLVTAAGLLVLALGSAGLGGRVGSKQRRSRAT